MDGYRFVNGKNVSEDSVLELVEHVQRTIMSAEVMEVEKLFSSDARAVAVEQRRQIALLSSLFCNGAGFWVNSRPRCSQNGLL